MSRPRCPICRRTITAEMQQTAALPFCSPRCRQVDLNRWLGEEYSVPTVHDEGEEDEPGANLSSLDDRAD